MRCTRDNRGKSLTILLVCSEASAVSTLQAVKQDDPEISYDDRISSEWKTTTTFKAVVKFNVH